MAALGAVLIGCASAPSRPEVVDPSSDPSAWIPPGEGELAVADRPVSEKPKPKPRARHLLQPNHREMENRLVQAKSGRPRS
ncbi:MAG TPA: hypothetical protein VM925_00845 [Labilithrix sp.]|nr:hypothetical protein [Labilithrix sp.]